MWLFGKRKKAERDSIVGELWEYDFSRKNKNRFELEDTEDLNSDIINSSLRLTARKPNVFVWSVNNYYRYRDFVLDAVISIDGSNDHSAGGILFRYADKGNYYYMMVSEDGYFRLDIVFNGSPRILIPWTACRINSRNEIRIRIIAHGSLIALFVEDIWVGEIEDDTIDAGYIAFGGQNFSNKGSALFFLSEIRLESRAVEVELIYFSRVKDKTIPVENRKRLAGRLFESGQYGAVLVQIKKISKTTSLDSELSFLLARSLGMLGAYQEALRALDIPDTGNGDFKEKIVLEKAGLLYRMNKLLELKEFLNTTPEILEENPFLLNLMGNTVDGLGMFKEAVAWYRKACSRDGENGIFQLNLARTLEKTGAKEDAFTCYYEAGILFFRSESFVELREVLSGMNRIKPGSQESRILEGKVLFQEGDTGEAFKLFKELREEGVEDTTVDFLFGILLKEMHREKEALALFQSAAEKEPSCYPYWFRYGETLHLMGLPAENAVLKAIGLEPDNPWAFNLYGLVLLSGNRDSEAKNILKKAVDLEPDSVDILINYSTAVARVDGMDSALELLSEKSDIPQVQNQFGNLLYDSGDFDKAAESYRRAVAGDPQNRNYRENLASALIKQDYILGAEEILSSLMEEQPSSSTLEMIAQVAFRKGEYRRADRSFQEAVRLEPDNYRILLNYGDFLYTRLEYKAAGEIASRVLSVYEKDKSAVGEKEKNDADLLSARVSSALNDTFHCSGCGREWVVPKNIAVIEVVRLHGEPDGESPAGKCGVCGKVYCVDCAVDHIKNSRFVCPDCDEYLKLSENYLKYLAMEYAGS